MPTSSAAINVWFFLALLIQNWYIAIERKVLKNCVLDCQLQFSLVPRQKKPPALKDVSEKYLLISFFAKLFFDCFIFVCSCDLFVVWISWKHWIGEMKIEPLKNQK